MPGLSNGSASQRGLRLKVLIGVLLALCITAVAIGQVIQNNLTCMLPKREARQ